MASVIFRAISERPTIRGCGSGSARRRRGMVGHVLSRFRPSERPVIDEAVSLAAQAVAVWIQQDIEVCMNRFNAVAGKEPS